MVDISRTGPKYNPSMLLASIFFWKGSTNTFQFSYGMLTPNLFDIAAITGLNPLGDTFAPTLETTYKNFILDNNDKESVEVSDQEHIAFLILWLSYYIFFSISLQVDKKFVPLAIQLRKGRHISLSKFHIANLYQSLGEASYKLKHLLETNKSFLASGPLWLL